MASPIGHIAAGAGIYAGMRRALLGDSADKRWIQWLLFGAALFFSLLPDADSIPGIWFGDFGAYHNNLSHSLAAALLAAFGGAWIIRSIFGATYWRSFAFVLLCYGVHVLMDFLTVGRGVMLFWPVTPARFQSPVKLFFGLEWSQGWISKAHLYTLANELALLGIGWLAYRSTSRRRSVS